MNRREHSLLLKAAALLEGVAMDIYMCNTIDGEWDQACKADKREHKDLISTASRLRVMAKQPEPGPERQ